MNFYLCSLSHNDLCFSKIKSKETAPEIPVWDKLHIGNLNLICRHYCQHLVLDFCFFLFCQNCFNIENWKMVFTLPVDSISSRFQRTSYNSFNISFNDVNSNSLNSRKSESKWCLFLILFCLCRESNSNSLDPLNQLILSRLLQLMLRSEYDLIFHFIHWWYSWFFVTAGVIFKERRSIIFLLMLGIKL